MEQGYSVNNNEFQIEFRLQSEDGSYGGSLYGIYRFMIIRETFLNGFGSATDVESLKKPLRNFTEGNCCLPHAVNNLPLLYTVYDDQGRIEYINDFSLVRSDLAAERPLENGRRTYFPMKVTQELLPCSG